MRPKLTIGMAVFDDYEGAWFTLQSLRMYHDLSQVELLVVDNKPDSAGSSVLKRQIESQMNGYQNLGARYIAMPEIVGTSAPRDRVFQEASGEAVMCIDSHVLLVPGAVSRLIRWYDSHPESKDLIHGPLLHDILMDVSTLFCDVWQAEMWGVWAQAWYWKNKQRKGQFSVYDRQGKAEFHSLEVNPRVIYKDIDMPYAAHQIKLNEMGAMPLGLNPDDQFEIPGQGLGLFSCRKEAWLGFNPLFRGFGGEEMYIHEKFRQAGHKVWCLGFLKWVHRFERPNGVKYPISRWNKVRNYVLGHLELGIPPFKIHEHFVASGMMDQASWDRLVANPELPDEPRTMVPKVDVNIDMVFEGVKQDQISYFRGHMETFKALAAKCEVVEEVSRFHETTIGLLTGRPKVLRTHVFGGNRNHTVYEALQQMPIGVEFTIERSDQFRMFDIQDCDMLLYKTEHCEHNLLRHLEDWHGKVKRFIVLHDTYRNGERLDDGGPGYALAMRAFAENHPEWFVYYHTVEGCGLTVLGRNPYDKPSQPVVAWLPGKGPGTELAEILYSLGIVPADNCDCKARANQMDVWGAEGCRENQETIIGWMRDGQDRWGWRDKLAAAGKALANGIAFKINWSDPFPGLIEESIRRAEAKK